MGRSAATQVSSYDRDTSTTSNSLYNSTYSYDGSGHLVSVYIADGRPRTVSYVTDSQGQVLTRQEADNVSTRGDPRELYYYFGGVRVGDIGNNGTSDTDYVTAIASRSLTPGTGAFRNGANTGVAFADFDQSYQPLNPSSSGTGSAYTVRDGDTLASIAAAVWGDAALWYLIADANGLGPSASLAAGTTLSIPGKVGNSHNDATTFKP